MMGLSLALVFLAALPASAASHAIKVVGEAAPMEVAEAIRTLLSDKCVQLLDPKGELLAEVWLRKAWPAKATEAQIKNGLTYAEIPETTLVGALRVVKQWTDYRKQKIKPGVYTLRIAHQPMDGDHMGTAPYNEFCLLSPAAADKSPALLEGKQLHELSAKTLPGTTHPVVMLLFPNAKTEDAPKLLDKQNGIWVLSWKEDVASAGQKGVLGLGLTLFGVTTAE